MTLPVDENGQLTHHISQVLRQHTSVTRRASTQKHQGIIRNTTACKGCDWEADTIDETAHERHVAETIANTLVEEAASWDLLMAILDRHYPEDVFPTMEDRGPDRDPGPRIVSLIRHLNAARPGDTRQPSDSDSCPPASTEARQNAESDPMYRSGDSRNERPTR